MGWLACWLPGLPCLLAGLLAIKYSTRSGKLLSCYGSLGLGWFACWLSGLARLLACKVAGRLAGWMASWLVSFDVL
jgi:hypothetical protein